jgi:hypothetical protein
MTLASKAQALVKMERHCFCLSLCCDSSAGEVVQATRHLQRQKSSWMLQVSVTTVRMLVLKIT